MKKSLLSLFVAAASALSLHAADVTSKISEVHLCCTACVRGVQSAVGDVQGVTAAVDRTNGVVTLTAPDAATVQKAADALVAAGYYGKSDGSVKLVADSGATGKKVEKMKLEGVHLCCGKCVTAVDKALKTVPGVKAHTAEKDADSFEVTGEFMDSDVIAALHKEGLTGKVAK